MGNEEPEVKEEDQVKKEEEQVKKEEKEEVEKEEEEKEEEEVEEEPDPSLELLWTFSCELTKGWNITCMAWNKQNTVRKTSGTLLCTNPNSSLHHIVN